MHGHARHGIGRVANNKRRRIMTWPDTPIGPEDWAEKVRCRPHQERFQFFRELTYPQFRSAKRSILPDRHKTSELPRFLDDVDATCRRQEGHGDDIRSRAVDDVT